MDGGGTKTRVVAIDYNTKTCSRSGRYPGWGMLIIYVIKFCVLATQHDNS